MLPVWLHAVCQRFLHSSFPGHARNSKASPGHAQLPIISLPSVQLKGGYSSSHLENTDGFTQQQMTSLLRAAGSHPGVTAPADLLLSQVLTAGIWKGAHLHHTDLKPNK